MNDLNDPLPIAEAMKRRHRAPRARVYWRLLWLIPGVALLASGSYSYFNVKDDGLVQRVQLTTKPGMVGQAAEAIRLVEPGNPDLYLKIKSTAGDEQTDPHIDTPIGNGLEWKLKTDRRLREFTEVEVWDLNTFSDDFLDRVTLAGWSADGQTFRINLLGQKDQPPAWALPAAAVGGAITLIALLRFVWDQVI